MPLGRSGHKSSSYIKTIISITSCQIFVKRIFIKEGQKVTFETEPDPRGAKGVRATNVVAIVED